MRDASAADSAAGRVHLAFLDGIRALAALWVVADHAYTPLVGELARHGWPSYSYTWLYYGHTAVDIFLVLSGFCLALPVARRGHLEGGARQFFARRCHRILPTYYAALLLCLALSLLANAVHPGRGHLPLSGLIVPGFLLQDILRGAYYDVNTPTWTVALEWKIYFLFPLFVWLWRRAHPLVMVAVAAAMACGLTWAYGVAFPNIDLGHACPWYVLLFALGVCAGGATGPARRSACSVTAAGAALVLAGVELVSRLGWHLHSLPLADAATGALFACVLIRLADPKPGRAWGAARRVLSWRPLVLLGAFSYSLYLVHYPLLGLYYDLYPQVPSDVLHLSLMFACLTLVVIPLVILCCYGFFLVCERPFLNTRRTGAPSPSPAPLPAAEPTAST